MAQEYGPAQPIADIVNNGMRIVQKWTGTAPPPKKTDPSWHNEMVKEANDSFAKTSTAKRVSAPSQGSGMKANPSKTNNTKKVITTKR